MESMKLEIFDNIVSVVEKLRNLRESEVEVWIPEGSVLFENSLSLKLIKKEAEKFGKSISFSTNDPAGQNLLDVIEGNGGLGTAPIGEDFVSREVGFDEVASSGAARRSRIPKFDLAGLKKRFSGIRIPKGKKLWAMIAGIIVFLLLVRFVFASPTAEVVITVESQPLVKSVELEVGTALKNDSRARSLEGRTFTASITKTKTGATTGEKQVGERASGKVTIYNYTDEEVELEAGHDFTGEDNDKIYNLVDDVTIPAATAPLPGDPAVPEEAEGEVEAEEIGEASNMDSDEILLVDDYSKSQVAAKSSEDIDGGKSETVKVVVQKDMDDLSSALLVEMRGDAEDALKNAVDSGWVMINGSESEGAITKEFNHKLDDEAEQIELTQTVTFQGLAYNQDAMDDVLDALLDEFVPEGFELSDEDREVNVEILGNTDATTLSTTSADLQVTLKSFVLPELDEEKIKNDLAGKKLSEAERILGGIRNVRSYEINMSGKIPFISRMPGKPENITLTIKKE